LLAVYHATAEHPNQKRTGSQSRSGVGASINHGGIARKRLPRGVLVPIPGDDPTTPTPLPFVITDRSSGTGFKGDFEKSRRHSPAVYFSTNKKQLSGI
jgi:hypothetical protein